MKRSEGESTERVISDTLVVRPHWYPLQQALYHYIVKEYDRVRKLFSSFSLTSIFKSLKHLTLPLSVIVKLFFERSDWLTPYMKDAQTCLKKKRREKQRKALVKSSSAYELLGMSWGILSTDQASALSYSILNVHVFSFNEETAQRVDVPSLRCEMRTHPRRGIARWHRGAKWTKEEVGCLQYFNT